MSTGSPPSTGRRNCRSLMTPSDSRVDTQLRRSAGSPRMPSSTVVLPTASPGDRPKSCSKALLTSSKRPSAEGGDIHGVGGGGEHRPELLLALAQVPFDEPATEGHPGTRADPLVELDGLGSEEAGPAIGKVDETEDLLPRAQRDDGDGAKTDMDTPVSRVQPRVLSGGQIQELQGVVRPDATARREERIGGIGLPPRTRPHVHSRHTEPSSLRHRPPSG